MLKNKSVDYFFLSTSEHFPHLREFTELKFTTFKRVSFQDNRRGSLQIKAKGSNGSLLSPEKCYNLTVVLFSSLEASCHFF